MVGVRRIIAIVSVAAALIGSAAMPALAGGPDDNVVLAIATQDEPTVERSALALDRTNADEVRSANVARAEARDCTGCRAVAVALQAVLVTGDPATVAPANVGLAVNTNCTRCASFAFAYQYVVSTGGPARLTSDGYRTIAGLRREASGLARSGLPFPELDARLKDVAARLKATVDAELVRGGYHPRERSERERTDVTPEGA